jgi:hypothetical protein
MEHSATPGEHIASAPGGRGPAGLRVHREIGCALEARQSGLQGVGDEVLLGGPAPVDRGLAGLGSGGDALHGEAVPADRTELLQRGVLNRVFE